jgi:phosphoribosyl-ATP pyrophosphohydrolase / phosphoribosyl-AMP cyclohydrolase / histidinol dehydrogenase
MLVVEFQQNLQLLPQISLASPVLIQEQLYDQKSNYKSAWVRVSMASFEHIIQILDSGADVVVLNFIDIGTMTMAQIEAGLENIPSSRLALYFKPDLSNPTNGPNFASMSSIFDFFIISEPPSNEAIVQLRLNFPKNEFLVHSTTYGPKELMDQGFSVVAIADDLQLGEEKSKTDYVELLMHNATSDRPDGLFATVVTDEQGIALGLCYSSKKSVSSALETQTGVYMSRTRGLWFKGKTSGATQKLLGVDFDCDSDTLRFKVCQTAPGFCHLHTRTCFGADQGITALFHLLESRLKNAPPKSYTKRLFNDSELLHSKILEEAEELCSASNKDEVAWEAADLIYFALTKCVASGVTITDVERHLDLRHKKITRRPGNAKPPKDQYIPSPQPQSGSVKDEISSNELFRMKVHEKKILSQSQLDALLLRPILNTTEILERVRPIVKQVREGGDKAVKEFTSKFDKVDLDSVVLKAPFPEELMKLDPDVKNAIDLAYRNIEKFHAAQLELEPLVVETMPGVTCTRFVRPIERVGLYVPGGTAVLPSSTLMLGVPAKVAGCKEIVIATPPTKEGNIVPEVVYVAHKVGASMIVKAGGAQAVAAMAYGTETVPKVDKICGPGNQYVTQAKMIAQVIFV